MHYPVNLDLNGRSCLVVGGGTVAARKVASLVACGAVVTVVALRIHADISKLTSVTIERRAYQRGDAATYRLVITATNDPATNQAVYDDAEAAGVWVNSADDPERCSFTLPAVVRRGSVLLTASTGSASPALSAWLRGQAICCVLLAAFYAMTLTLVGLDLGLIVGMAAGLLSFIPYVGSVAGGVTSIADRKSVV